MFHHLMQAMAEMVAENVRGDNPARTPQELAAFLLQGGNSREALEARLPGIMSTLYGRGGGGSGAGGATSSMGEPLAACAVVPWAVTVHMMKGSS